MKRIVFTLTTVAFIGISEMNAQEQKSQEKTATPEAAAVTPKKATITTANVEEPKALKVKQLDAKSKKAQPAVTPVRSEQRRIEAVKIEDK